MLELQSALPGAFGHCFHAAVILITSAVENDLGDAGGLRALGDALANFGGLLGLLHAENVEIPHRGDGVIPRVVHELRVDVLERAEDDEPRALLGAGESPPDPDVPAFALRRCGLCFGHDYLPPALPALRRMTSPAYRMPFPLYGSGGRMLRISAATCPTFSLSAPSITIVVGCGAVSFTPAGALYSIECEKPRASGSRNGFTSSL